MKTKRVCLLTLKSVNEDPSLLVTTSSLKTSYCTFNVQYLQASTTCPLILLYFRWTLREETATVADWLFYQNTQTECVCMCIKASVCSYFVSSRACRSRCVHVCEHGWWADLELTWNTHREPQSASPVPPLRQCQSSVNHSAPPTHKSAAKTTHQRPLGEERRVGAVPLDNDSL